MEERAELVYQDGADNARTLLAKWLKFLLMVQLISIVVSVVSLFGILGFLSNVLSIGLAICVVAAMFQLSAVNEHYRKAFIFGLVQLISAIVGLLFTSSIITLVGSICNFVAVYQEYQGHSEIVSAGDSILSRKWLSLFIWELVVGLVVGVITTAAAMIGVYAGAESSAIVSIVLVIGAIPSVALEVLYLLYLKKTLALFA